MFNTELLAMTVQERLCEIKFCPDQRLMVRLPFAENPRVLGKTWALDQRRFSHYEWVWMVESHDGGTELDKEDTTHW